MKKILLVVLSIITMFTTACNKKTDENLAMIKIALITDYDDVTDKSFNEYTHKGILAFVNDNKKFDYRYYKPSDPSTPTRIATIERAIKDGYSIIILPGYAFSEALVSVSKDYPDVKFIALDISKNDLLATAVPLKGEKYDYNPTNWDLEKYCYIKNVYCAVYQEEIAGYLAGYVAVKLGYNKLGFLGGMAVPAVVRYGYGFVQGADVAAIELNKEIEIKYAYGNQFFGDAEITLAMKAWYKSGTEVVFACGGSIYTSVAEVAKDSINKKVIGVDVDQAPIIDTTYGQGLTITSAMKGLYPTVYNTLTDILINDKWENYAGKIEVLGLKSADKEEEHYVGLPLNSTQWSQNFTQKDYKALVSKIYKKEVLISNDITSMPTTKKAKVINLGNIK